VGPYFSERQRGTVHEDYSPEGDAWNYLPHDHACSRAYRWGEDGLAGFCDIEQRLCVAVALWNGRDPIPKERSFGLTGAEANHGEDVKEYWWDVVCETFDPARKSTAAHDLTVGPRTIVILQSRSSRASDMHYIVAGVDLTVDARNGTKMWAGRPNACTSRRRCV
jgi:hypothetical protein